MAMNGEGRMEKQLVIPTRLGALRIDETEENLENPLRSNLLRSDATEEEEATAVGGVAGLVGRCESLSLAGGVEGGGFKIPGLVAEGGGAGRRMFGGAGSDGEEGGGRFDEWYAIEGGRWEGGRFDEWYVIDDGGGGGMKNWWWWYAIVDGGGGDGIRMELVRWRRIWDVGRRVGPASMRMVGGGDEGSGGPPGPSD